MAITKENAVTIVTELLNKAHSKFKQEFDGENEEVLDRIIRQHRAAVARRSWKTSQKWCKWNDEGPVLMPDFTRIYYRKGNTEVLVREFPPQIRLMKYQGMLAHRNSESDPKNDPELFKANNYSLALPYVVFLFKFVDGMFDEVRCAFSDRPLQKLDEQPLKPYLSNLDNTLKVCLGQSFDKSELQKDNVFQQSSYVLSYFWQAVNSNEWSQPFWQTKKHFQDNDPRLATMEAWQENSLDNPLFVIDDVKWLKHSEESFGDMIVRLFENDQSNTKFHDDLYNELVDDFLKEVDKSLKANLDTVESKIITDHVDSLADDLMAKINQLGN